MVIPISPTARMQDEHSTAKHTPSNSDPRADTPLQFYLGRHYALWGWHTVRTSLLTRLTGTPHVAKHKLRRAALQLLKCSKQRQ